MKFTHGALCIGSAGGPVTSGATSYPAVYRVSPASGQLTTVAGQGAVAGDGDDGTLASAVGVDACNATMDPAGNLLLADMGADYGENQDYGQPPPRVRVVPDKTGTYYGQHMMGCP